MRVEVNEAKKAGLIWGMHTLWEGGCMQRAARTRASLRVPGASMGPGKASAGVGTC